MLVEYSIKRLNDAVRLTGNLIFQVFIFAVEFIVNKIRLILHFAFCCVSILLALFVKLLSVPNTLGDLMLKRKRYVFKSSYAFFGAAQYSEFFYMSSGQIHRLDSMGDFYANCFCYNDFYELIWLVK